MLADEAIRGTGIVASYAAHVTPWSDRFLVALSLESYSDGRNMAA